MTKVHRLHTTSIAWPGVRTSVAILWLFLEFRGRLLCITTWTSSSPACAGTGPGIGAGTGAS